MSESKVVVSDYVFESFDAERGILAAVGADLEVLQCKSAEELIPHLADAHALLNTYLPGIDKAVFDAAPKLKAVVRYGIGVDTIDVPEATRHGVMVANVPDYCIEEVSSHALALFLCLNRKVAFSDAKVKAGEWSLSYVKPVTGIAEMTCGIIGFGRIGREIARRLAGFGPTILFSDPVIAAAEVDGCRRVELDDLFAQCDAIFVQCPANERTRHLLGREAFVKMQRKPVIINAARGEIVDTEALVEALGAGLISGAGLDVVEDEKALIEPDHPLRKLGNVVLTPHSAWYSTAAIRKLQRNAAEEVARVLRGEKPRSLINPEVLEAK
jgi:D-3-phosphoglycerate dehydrogenase